MGNHREKIISGVKNGLIIQEDELAGKFQISGEAEETDLKTRKAPLGKLADVFEDEGYCPRSVFHVFEKGAGDYCKRSYL